MGDWIQDAKGRWGVKRIDVPPGGVRATWLWPSLPAAERELAAALDDLLRKLKAQQGGYDDDDLERSITHAERILQKALERAR